MSCKNGKNLYTPVTPFIAEKYLGTWYEIARLPNSFEKDMTHVTATYSLKENGKVKVVNKGLLNEKQKEAIGKAYLAGVPNEGFLKVSFFGPFYADYIIVDLDENYTYAMVASSLEYLWILSREPVLDKVVLDKLLEKAKKLGFDTSKLYFTPQKG
jgi:apolipoprotein D and lipocalin family protein